MRVERDAAQILVGDWPAHPEQTALLEARGALLAWDVLSDDPVPAARIHDADHAADWLWEIYGTAAADILGDADEVAVPAEGDWRIRDAGRTVAHLGWIEAWWPASVTVPEVDHEILLAERAVATSEVECLLDDEDATEHALAAASLVEAFAQRLAELAEDYGVVLRAAVPQRQSDFALAAGGARAEGVIVLSGTNPVDWSLVPAGIVDAEAEAEWAVVRSAGQTYLDVAVPLVTRSATRLVARFAQVDVPLDEMDDFGRLTGRVPVPPTVLLLSPAQRVLTVYAPDFAEPAEPDVDSSIRRSAIIEYARSRPASPLATFTERSARR
jgi:hypothetical protein